MPIDAQETAFESAQVRIRFSKVPPIFRYIILQLIFFGLITLILGLVCARINGYMLVFAD